MSVADLSNLTPTQVAVYEVVRRLHEANLPDPTMDTIAQLTKLKPVAAAKACVELAGMGLLIRGGRSSRSFALPAAKAA